MTRLSERAGPISLALQLHDLAMMPKAFLLKQQLGY